MINRAYGPLVKCGLIVSSVFIGQLTSSSCQAQEVPADKSDAPATSKIESLPGYQAYQEISGLRRKMARLGRVSNARWSEDSKLLSFKVGDDEKVIDLATGQETETEFNAATPPARSPRFPTARAGRAEQRTWTVSPDKKWKAVYQDFNVALHPFDATLENQADLKSADPATVVAVTEDGNEKTRYGTCCWVYGEELSQSDAMWWSPDGKKLAFYEVAETHMKDYPLSVKNTEVYPTLETTRYPTAGEANPHVALLIYDLESKETVRVKVDGPEDQYIYDIDFTADGKHLRFHRTNRWQNELDVMLADVETGESRSIVTETQETWQENSPTMRFLQDGTRFVWATERSGFNAYELRDISGKRLNAVSAADAEYPCGSIIELDEDAGWLYYVAYADANPYNAQLFRGRLDGTKVERLTEDSLSFSGFQFSPDHKYFTATGETAETPPKTFLFETGNTTPTAILAESDLSELEGLQRPEFFNFTADDGKTQIWGVLYKPSNFDESKKYPLVIDVYGGPNSTAFSNRFGAGNPGCEFGFVIAKIGNRGTVGRGKAFESATYMRLGTPDLADQVAGVKHLAQRSYIDASRVGIYGHSYGGYMTALALLKFPEVFHVGVSGAPVTHWKNYDTIYTERYMRTPQVNSDGYESGSCMKFADQLQGNLLLVHGLMDDNVHPSNTWQLIDALYKADKRFDLLIYPGFRHGVGSTYPKVRWEYLVKHLKPKVN